MSVTWFFPEISLIVEHPAIVDSDLDLGADKKSEHFLLFKVSDWEDYAALAEKKMSKN